MGRDRGRQNPAPLAARPDKYGTHCARLAAPTFSRGSASLHGRDYTDAIIDRAKEAFDFRL